MNDNRDNNIYNNDNTRREWFINVIRQHLQLKKVEFAEYTTKTGSHYFHLNLHNNSNPCIRVSDHRASSSMSRCVSLIYSIGRHTNKTKLRGRIVSTVDNVITKGQAYSITKVLGDL